MKKFLAPLMAAVVVAVGSSARADTTWTYSWNNTSLDSVSTGLASKQYTLHVVGATSSPSVTTPTPVPGSSYIIAANTYISPNVVPTTADSFNGSFTLAGLINGHNVSFDISVKAPYITWDGTTSTFASGLQTWTSSGAVSWTDGSGSWKAEVVSMTPAGSLGTGQGAIGVLVTTPNNDHGHPPGTPEPSTMLLSCVGLAMGGFATWRKRKQAAQA